MSAIEPRIMTLSEFRRSSTPANPFKRGRGPALHLIDQSLEAYDRVRDSTPPQRKPVVTQIVLSCRNWLNAKAGKTSAASQTRRAAVNTLGAQAFEWLKFQEFADRKTVTRVTATVAGRGPDLRAMRPGYAPERAMYVASGKQQQPVSGSYMHEVMESRPGHTYRGRTFAQLTADDFRSLDTAYGGTVSVPDVMGDPGAMAKTQVPRQVLFLNKQDRIKCLLLVRDGLLWEGFEAPFDTGIMLRAYVIDQYGCLYSSNQIFDKKYSFNHSTFNAGKDVLCAGTLKVAQGRLTMLSNSSGHYKPTRANLHNAVRMLDGLGADISGLRVVVGEPDPGRPGKMVEHDYDSAATFLADMNAVPSRTVAQP